ncbi:hypothetical protein GGI07_002491 [Coemansia sp. Benny D115]|nr:hypothetical protein GGI07_002491 [Coemansia sp. Benny D115]
MDSGLLEVGRQISHVLEDPQISPLYVAHFVAQAQKELLQMPRADWPETVRRVFSALEKAGVAHVSRIYHVASDYYSWPLYERALCMSAPSPAHMCKSVLLENKRWRPEHPGSRYYCVMVQYVHSVNTTMMADFVRALDGDAIARKHFNFRLTSPETTFEMTGYDKNGVSPFGVYVDVPVILCESITRLQPPVFWLGAGHVDYKLAMPADHFIRATKSLVADISLPATNLDDEQ